MDFPSLDRDRFLKKDPSQSDQTKGAAYAAINPKPKTGDDQKPKIGQPNPSQEDGGAPNILTGTVIVSCFIQTSALPSRIELQGNDLTFFDDTTESDGQIKGDTSRLIFTHSSAKRGEQISSGFIIEKRCSTFNSYDNVLSLYSPQPPAGDHNYIFIGRNAFDGGRQDRNISSTHFSIDFDSTFHPAGKNPLNGVWEVEYSESHVYKSRLIFAGNTQSLFPGAPFTGYSAVMIAGEGGLTGLGYTPAAGGLNVLLYVAHEDSISLGADLIPDTDAAYDIGTASFRVKDIYISGTIHGGGTTRTSYGGQVDAAAVAANLPSGWTVGKVGTIYTITHNLGTTNYQPVFYVGSFSLWGILQGALGANSFSVDFENSGGTPFSTDWGFVISLI